MQLTSYLSRTTVNPPLIPVHSTSNVTARVARMTYGSSIDEVLNPGEDLVIPLMLPGDFVSFARGMLDQAFQVSTMLYKF